MEDIISSYINGESTIKLAEKYNLADSTVGKFLSREGVEIRSPSESKRSYKINETYFDSIDSESKAYIIGFLYADGCNVESRNNVRLSLHKDDIEIIEFFRRELYFNNDKPIGEYRNQVYLDITNKHISERLAELGIMSNKTFKVTFPKYLNKNLYKHFIRGYFDGDGCLTHYFTGTAQYFKCKFSLLGTKDFCEGVSEHLGLKGSYEYPVDNIVRWSLSGRRQILQVMEYLYSDSNIYLKRKFNKYLYIKNYERKEI